MSAEEEDSELPPLPPSVKIGDGPGGFDRLASMLAGASPRMGGGGYESDSSASSDGGDDVGGQEWPPEFSPRDRRSPGGTVTSRMSMLQLTADREKWDALSQLQKNRTRKWLKMIGNWAKYQERKPDKLKRRVRKGIPDIVRKQAWGVMVGLKGEMARDPEMYQQLCNAPPSTDAAKQKQLNAIDKDIDKSLKGPLKDHLLYERHTDGQERLRRVLRALVRYDPEVGYTVGLGSIAAMLLIYFHEDETFYVLKAIMNRFPGPLRGLYTPDRPLAKEEMTVADSLVQKFMPQLWRHLDAQEMHYSTYFEEWLVSLFTKGFPLEVAARVWDAFLHEGLKIIYRVQIALLKMHQKDILARNDFQELVKYLTVELPGSVDSTLLDTAFSLSLSHTHIQAAQTDYKVGTVSGEAWVPPSAPPTLKGEKHHGLAYDSGDSSASSTEGDDPSISKWGIFASSINSVMAGPVQPGAVSTGVTMRERWNQLTPKDQERTRKWFKMISNWHKYQDKKGDKLKRRVRKGIPDIVRRQAWGVMVGLEGDMIKEPDLYRTMCMHNDIGGPQAYDPDIDRDIQGVLEGHALFTQFPDGQARLRRVLRAYARHDPEVGYSPGLGHVVAWLLTYFNEDESFYVLRALMKRYPGPLRGLYTPDRPLVKEMISVGDALVRRFLPQLSRHLEMVGRGQRGLYFQYWLVPLFSKGFKSEVTARVWDAFLLEGLKVVYRLQLAILKTHLKEILRLSDYDGVMLHLTTELPEHVDTNILDTAFALSLSHTHIDAAQANYQVRAVSGETWDLPPTPWATGPPALKGEKKREEGYESDSSSGSDDNDGGKEASTLSRWGLFSPKPPSATQQQQQQPQAQTQRSRSLSSPSSSTGSQQSITNTMPSFSRTQREKWNQLTQVQQSRTRKWLKMVSHWNRYREKKPDKLKRRVRKGIPDIVRRQAWGVMLNLDAEMAKAPDLYKELVQPDQDTQQAQQAPPDSPDEHIDRDISSVLQSHVLFQRVPDGQDRLRRVLRAYARHDPEVGYHPALAHIAAMVLLYFNEEECFHVLRAVMNRPFAPVRGLYTPNKPLAKEMVSVGDSLVRRFLPQVSRHLEALDQTQHGMYFQEWLLHLFSKGFSQEVTARVWDAFFFGGYKVMYRVLLALLKTNQRDILSMHNLDSTVRYFTTDLPARVDTGFLDTAFALSLSHTHIDAAKAEHRRTNSS